VAGPLPDSNQGLFNPKDQSFDCHVNADFTGAWDKEEALEDPDTARSRSGFNISYLNYPIIWTSKLQTTIALSLTESEYVALSLALRDVIPLMGLVKEMQAFGFDCHATTAPTVYCRAFEDNSGALEMATDSAQVPPKDEAHKCGIPSFQIVH
jgi:hypothetical protein